MAKVVILSGAGISAESGISTFRDSDGLWENYNIKEVCTDGCLETNRSATIEFYDKRRADISDKQPNKAHLEIVKLKEKYPNDISIITQNVDDLFEKAGCNDVLHLHGFLKEIRCEYCNYIEDIGYIPQDEAWECCPMCKKTLRPNVVFFNEKTSKYEDMFYELEDCEMLVVIGTSGAVLILDLFLSEKIKYSILNNLEPSIAINHEKFTKAIFKSATQAIDKIVEDIESFLNRKGEI
jgi:NAD-dependent deacetylase